MNRIQELEKGVQLHSQGNYKEAESIYCSILIELPDCPDTLNLMGLSQSENTHFTAAENNFKKAIELKSDRCDFHFNLAECLRLSSRYDEAIKAYNLAIKINHNFQEAYINRSYCHIEKKSYELAAQDLKNVLNINPANIDAFHNLGKIYTLSGNSKKALKYFDDALNICPDNISIITAKIDYLLKFEDSLKAKAFCDSKVHLEHEVIHNALGVIAKERKDYKSAIKFFEDALTLNPNYAEAQNNLALIHKKNGKLNIARSLLEEATKNIPEESSYAYNLAGVYNLLNDKEKALDSYQKALTLSPDNTCIQHMINALQGEESHKAPEKYVQTLFDVYAESFDHDLVKTLQYQTPQELAALISTYYPGRHFENLFDAGCGTGLCGNACQEFTSQRTGVDLSPKMLEKADQKGIYQKLLTGDIIHELANSQEDFDLITAADVLISLGDLRPFLQCCFSKLKHNGVLAFSLETCSTGFQLLQSGRYAHSAEYLKGLINEIGYDLTIKKSCNLRKNIGDWIEGELYILSKP